MTTSEKCDQYASEKLALLFRGPGSWVWRAVWPMELETIIKDAYASGALATQSELTALRQELERLRTALPKGRGGLPGCGHGVVEKVETKWRCARCHEGFMSYNDAQVLVGFNFDAKG